MTDLTPIPTKITCQPPSVHDINAPPVNASDHIIGDFPELLIPHFKLSDTNKHGVEHHITAPSPHYVHVPATWMQTVSVTKAEFVKMEQLGIICCFSSLWASLLRVVRKSVGGWWPCRDFCCLNNANLDDHYSSPHIQDFNTNLQAQKYLQNWSHPRLPLDFNATPRTAIITLLLDIAWNICSREPHQSHEVDSPNCD